MPALARKIAPDHHDHRTTAARSTGKAVPNKPALRRRWHEDKPESRAHQSTHAAPDAREVADLLSHFGHGSAEKESKVRAQMTARREVLRRARRRHRPFRLTAIAGVLGAAPLCLLACLLWLRSSALALTRQDAQLQNQISAARFELERTHKETAALNASPHIEQWAKDRKWRQATQQDFDQVPSTDQVPPTSENADASNSASTPAAAASENEVPAASR